MSDLLEPAARSLAIDLRDGGYSVFGSYLCFWYPPDFWGHDGLMLRSVRGDPCELFQIDLLDASGSPQLYTDTATADGVRLETADGGWCALVMHAPDVARLRTGNGARLRLVSVARRPGESYAFQAGANEWRVNLPHGRTHLALSPLAGALSADSQWYVKTFTGGPNQTGEPAVTLTLEPDANGEAEVQLEDFLTTPTHVRLALSFGECQVQARRGWEEWRARAPEVPALYQEAAERAMWVNYAAVVNPAPHAVFRRPTMLMSKNWMLQCWSWDHVFNAIALAYRQPELAWDQLMTLFDHQGPDGALPDSVGPIRLGWNFCKPPVHGWAVRKMLAAGLSLSAAECAAFYAKLAKWTQWWFATRDLNGDGLPEYQHGNDSGWDNATVFDEGVPVTTPDLQALLIVQLHALADLAERIDCSDEARDWRLRADTLLSRFLEHLWTGNAFVSRGAFTGNVQGSGGDSLLNAMAIIGGEYLPKPVAKTLAEALQPDGRFITQFGPATESPHSPLYVPDGYWRGPIWGSETVLLVDGLARAGYREQATEIARRYCELCRRSLCFAENYNATTGEPLRDRAYTWGSSAFLILAHEFLR
ncbi:MAG: amylo-alpha-1,6-glucosidase [Opitutales bacterium]